MVETEQIRKWYYSGVVLNHADRGEPGYEPICNHNYPTVKFPREGGGFYNEPVHPLTVDAWRAYIIVMVHHGETMPGAGGVNHCRNIDDSNYPSLHAYLCAVDLPPNSRKSLNFLMDMTAIRTNSGVRVFRNLASDRMHDQINCSPADLATGIDYTTVAGATKGEDMTLKEGNTGNDVRFFQKALNNWPGTDPDLPVSGVFDAAMTKAVKKYQGAANVDVTGEIGWLTGVLLAEYNPDKVAPPAPAPPELELDVKSVQVVRSVRIKP